MYQVDRLVDGSSNSDKYNFGKGCDTEELNRDGTEILNGKNLLLPITGVLKYFFTK